MKNIIINRSKLIEKLKELGNDEKTEELTNKIYEIRDSAHDIKYILIDDEIPEKCSEMDIVEEKDVI